MKKIYTEHGPTLVPERTKTCLDVICGGTRASYAVNLAPLESVEGTEPTLAFTDEGVVLTGSFIFRNVAYMDHWDYALLGRSGDESFE